ncbi:LAETG motif-containing sortase-dependent surface protein [Streptomyces sp. NPDC055749]
MKLRRTLALAAATAVIAPAVILTAPAAFADTVPVPTATTDSPAPTDTTSPSTGTTTEPAAESPSATTDTTPSVTPSETEEAGAAVAPASPTASESETATPTPTPTATESELPEEPVEEEVLECEPRPLELAINGLSGSIVRGSGWHSFKFNVYNDSETTVKNVMFFAGAAADNEGQKLFSSQQVQLQALNEETGSWENLSEGGTASGYVGATDEIKPGYEIDIPLRIKVKASAPVGVGFSLGGGLVFGEEMEPCFSDVAYKFKIVESGDEDGAKPQEGGKVPLPAEKPADADTAEVTGSLAETGSSSSTTVFALVGGAAVVLGAGAMFLVRRRKNADTAE